MLAEDGVETSFYPCLQVMTFLHYIYSDYSMLAGLHQQHAVCAAYRLPCPACSLVSGGDLGLCLSCFSAEACHYYDLSEKGAMAKKRTS